jgi:hypothetical protein
MSTAAVFRGYATVEGTVGTYDVLATGITPLNESAKLTGHWEDEILKDNHGYDFSWIMRNEHGTLDLELYFVADTAAHAAIPVKVVTPAAGVSGTGAGASVSALGTAPLLGPGSIIILTTFTLTALNGSWRVLSGSEATLTNTKAVKYALKLLRYASSDQQTQMSTVPT